MGFAKARPVDIQTSSLVLAITFYHMVHAHADNRELEFSGGTLLQHTSMINEMLESGCGSEKSPLMSLFSKCTKVYLVTHIAMLFPMCQIFYVA